MWRVGQGDQDHVRFLAIHLSPVLFTTVYCVTLFLSPRKPIRSVRYDDKRIIEISDLCSKVARVS